MWWSWNYAAHTSFQENLPQRRWLADRLQLLYLRICWQCSHRGQALLAVPHHWLSKAAVCDLGYLTQYVTPLMGRFCSGVSISLAKMFPESCYSLRLLSPTPSFPLPLAAAKSEGFPTNSAPFPLYSSQTFFLLFLHIQFCLLRRSKLTLRESNTGGGKGQEGKGGENNRRQRQKGTMRKKNWENLHERKRETDRMQMRPYIPHTLQSWLQS